MDTVCDRESFLRFADALTADRKRAGELEREKPSSGYGRDAGGWENRSIEAFLDAATAWATATKQLPTDPSPADLWRFFATFLYSGKIYE